jgi:hypothetical protein
VVRSSDWRTRRAYRTFRGERKLRPPFSAPRVLSRAPGNVPEGIPGLMGRLASKQSVYGLSTGAILNAVSAIRSQRRAHGRQLTYAKSMLCIACRYRCNVPSCCDCVYLQTMQRLSQALEGSPSVPHMTRMDFDNRSAWKTSGDGRFANAPIRFSPKDHSEGSVSQLGRTISPLRKADCDRSCAA